MFLTDISEYTPKDADEDKPEDVYWPFDLISPHTFIWESLVQALTLPDFVERF